MRTRRRDLVFLRAMRRFLKDPGEALSPASTTVSDLIYGWGNERWSALEEYLTACICHAMNPGGAVLECGSGLTTIVLGALAQRFGYAVWSLEHGPAWAKRVEANLERFGIDSVRLSRGPLRRYSGFTWYEPPLDLMPNRFGLIVCDGPPGRTHGGRYGLVPVMGDRMGVGSVILLDDAGRRKERSIAERWKRELPATCEWLGLKKPFIRMTVGSGIE